MTTMEMGRWWE